MKPLEFCIAIVALTVGVKCQCPLFNEIRIRSSPNFEMKVEVYNPANTDTLNFCYLTIYGTTGNIAFSIKFGAIGPNGHFVFTPQLSLVRTDDYLLVMSQSGPINSPLTDLDPADFIDTFYYPIRDKGNPYPFNSHAPEWSNQGLWGPGDSISRCQSLQQRDPSAWEVTTPDTIGSLQDCSASTEGDPHFVQMIVDKRTGKLRKVCYDIGGKSGQSIYILKDNVHDIKVEGVLFDDYYMHDIRLTIEGRRMSISVHGIIYKGNRYEWEGYSILYFDEAKLTLSENAVTVQIEKNDRTVFTANIVKMINRFNIEHLDVRFADMGKDLTRYSGVIGDVQQMEFVIFEGIQFSNSVEISVDGRIINGRLERRDDTKCLLLNFHSLVGAKVDQYVY